MTAPQAPAPVPVAPAPAAEAPVAGAGVPAPVAGTGESATDAAGMDEVAWQIAAQADCKNSIVAEPGGGGAQEQTSPTGQTVG